MSSNRSRSIVVLLVAASALVLGACGSGGSGPDAQPRTQTSTFGSGAFDDIPLHPGSDVVQEPNQTGDVVAATYAVVTAQPRTVLQFYRRALRDDGWVAVDAVSEDGRDVWRGTWRRDGKVLEVSSAPAPGLEDGNYENPAQYSLVLRPG